jgi:hypothetical protein
MRTQRQRFYQSHDKLSGAMHVFVHEIAPTLTRDEFERLCVKRPAVYQKYREYMEAMFRDQSSNT